MSEISKQTAASQDPTSTIETEQVELFKDIDLHSPEILKQLTEDGELFRRKIEPIRGVREPSEDESIDTVVNGIVESSQVAKPGQHKIITGSRGEEFVLANEKYDGLYREDEEGNVVPRERFIVAMQNPYGESVRTEAPWSTPEDPQFTDGTSEAMLAFSLDDEGKLTSDRYIIGDRDMLLANYDPATEEKEKQEHLISQMDFDTPGLLDESVMSYEEQRKATEAAVGIALTSTFKENAEFVTTDSEGRDQLKLRVPFQGKEAVVTVSREIDDTGKRTAYMTFEDGWENYWKYEDGPMRDDCQLTPCTKDSETGEFIPIQPKPNGTHDPTTDEEVAFWGRPWVNNLDKGRPEIPRPPSRMKAFGGSILRRLRR